MSKVQLHAFEKAHQNQTRVWSNIPENMRFLGRFRPISDVEHQQWFETLHHKQHAIFFAIHYEKHHVGNVWLWDIDWRNQKAEVRILIGETAHHNKGMGTEALIAISDYAFNVCNLQRIYAYVLSINPRAKRSFEKAGFEMEGTLKRDRWVDDTFVNTWLLSKLRR